MKVLLARPNDFLVDHMRGWLTELGFEVVRLRALKELREHAPAEVAGLVISTAVTSSIHATLEEAFASARAVFPRHPVILAGLAGVASARAGLGKAFAGSTLSGPEEAASWGTPEVLLYVTGDQLRARAPALSAAARTHFGARR